MRAKDVSAFAATVLLERSRRAVQRRKHGWFQRCRGSSRSSVPPAESADLAGREVCRCHDDPLAESSIRHLLASVGGHSRILAQPGAATPQVRQRLREAGASCCGRRGSQQRAFAAFTARGSILEALLNALHVVDLLARSPFAVVRSAIRPLALSTEKFTESHATNRIAAGHSGRIPAHWRSAVQPRRMPCWNDGAVRRASRAGRRQR